MPSITLPELTFHDRAMGLLLGLAVGDALGAPLVGMKAAHIHQTCGFVEDFTEADTVCAGKPRRWIPRGLHAAPTQLALAAGDAMFLDDAAGAAREEMRDLADGEEDGDDGAGILRGNPHRLRLMARVLRDDKLGLEGRDFGVSATPAVAALPLALRMAIAPEGDPAEVAAAIAGLLTDDFRGVAAAAAAVRAAGELARGVWDAPGSGAEASAALAVWTREAEIRIAQKSPELTGAAAPETRHAVSDALRALAAAFAEGNDDLARRSIASEAARHAPGIKMDDPQAYFAPANLAWALYLALRDRRFDRAVCDAINGGRETGAMGALAGAFCGARLGAGALPRAWRDGLLARAFLENRAEAYATGDPSVIYEENLISHEREWTRQMIEGRRQRLAALAEKQKRQEEKRPKKTGATPVAPPPSTYARRGQTMLDAALPEEERRQKALRGRKRIEWKEERRHKKRDER